MNNSAAHTALKASILLAHGARPDVRLFNNPVGEGWIGKAVAQNAYSVTLLHPRRVVFGLAPGSSDTAGWRSLIITEEMVGRRLAQIVVAEVKTGSAQPTEDQRRFLAAVAAAGGLAGVVRSVDDMGALLAGSDLFGGVL